jgi:hypothetical protein
VTCACADALPSLAVTVAVVFAVTALVGIANEADELPASMSTDAGGLTNGELLVRVTRVPPAGACPLSIAIPCGCAPPLIVLGEIVSDFNDGGCKVNCDEADLELSVAVSVTGVGAVTCPACTWNCIQAVLPGIVTVAGTGSTLGFELLRLIVAPPDATAAVNCNSTHVDSPLKSGSLASATETGVGGAELMVNVPVADHAVNAAVVGDESPCAERTRQNFVPEVSDRIFRVGPLSCGSSTSMEVKDESRAI